MQDCEEKDCNKVAEMQKISKQEVQESSVGASLFQTKSKHKKQERLLREISSYIQYQPEHYEKRPGSNQISNLTFTRLTLKPCLEQHREST